MRIDWTQTLMGSADGGAGRGEAPAVSAGEGVRDRMLHRLGVARLAGVLGVSVCLGLVILAWPVRGPASTIIDSLGLCGILIAQVLGYLSQLLGFYARRGPLAWLCSVSGWIGVPFALAAGMPAGVVVALMGLAALEAVLVPLALRMPSLTPLVPSVGAAMIAAAGAGFAPSRR